MISSKCFFKNHRNKNLPFGAAAMSTAATETTTTARGCWPRNRRRMVECLHALLAAIAVGSCVLRTLDADERPG
jgi:hypothetical protein